MEIRLIGPNDINLSGANITSAGGVAVPTLNAADIPLETAVGPNIDAALLAAQTTIIALGTDKQDLLTGASVLPDGVTATTQAISDDTDKVATTAFVQDVVAALSPSGGTVTEVTSSDAYIGVATGTTTPVLTANVGTGANQIVALDGSAKLPAVDGSQLTNLPTNTGAIEFVMTAALGVAGDIVVPFACTITSVTLVADQTGSIVVDIWKDSYANFPPTVADTITASAKPTLSTEIKAQDSTLTGWAKTIAAGDVLRFNVDSFAVVAQATIALNFTRI